MDINTIMQNMRGAEYTSKMEFKADVELIFDNCREFNEAGTEMVSSANHLTRIFKQFWHEFGMNWAILKIGF